MVRIGCPDPEDLAPILLKALRSGCRTFSEELLRLTAGCRTPTKLVVPKYYLAMLGDRIGRLMSSDDLSLLSCWCEVEGGVRVVLALSLSRLAMSFPEEAYGTARGLEGCGGRDLLSRWVYPVVAIWDPSYLDRLNRHSYLMSWAWLATYSPDDFDLALERVMMRSDVVDDALIRALRRLRKVNPSRTYERIRKYPYILSRVIP